MRLIAIREIVDMAVAGKDDVLGAMFSAPYIVVSDWYSDVRGSTPAAPGQNVPDASETVVREVLGAMEVLICPGQSEALREELESRHAESDTKGWGRCLRVLIARFPPPAYQLELFSRSDAQSRGSLATRSYPLLYQAIRTGRPEIIELCAAASPDDAGRSVRISDAFDALSLTDRGPELLRFLLDRSSVKFVADPEAPEIGLQRIAMLSVQYGHVAMVRELSERGVGFSSSLSRGDHVWGFNGQPLTVYDFRRKTSEFSACPPVLVAPTVEMIELLESLGADIKAGMPNVLGGEAALFMALRTGSNEVLRYLVERRGFDVNVHNDEGATPLHVAVRAGTLEQVKYLLDHGAKINARDHEGWTPIKGVFVSKESVSKLRLLASCGADIFARSLAGESAFGSIGEGKGVRAADEIIRSVLPDSVAAKLGAKGAVPTGSREVISDYIVSAVKTKQFDLALQAMAGPLWDPAVTGGRGVSPVLAFIEAGGVRGALARKSEVVREAIDLALAKGFDLEFRDRADNTALMQAVITRNASAIAYLIDIGADRDVLTVAGKPLESLTRDHATKAAIRSAITAHDIGCAIGTGEGRSTGPQGRTRSVALGVL